MKSFSIGSHTIGEGNPCFIIAEMSANHSQNYEKAVEIVKAAAAAGADAIKLQTYKPETMTMDSDKPCFWVDGDENPESWKRQTFFELYKKAYTPWEEWHGPLQKLAHERGMEFLSTPFDPTAVDFLETLGVPCYKIASYEATDIPLLKRIARTKKPVIMSVGFASLEEIELSIQTLRENGTDDLAILLCTTSYSDVAHPEATNLATMKDLVRRFDCIVGFSDNMGGVEVPALAAAAGAAIIEKHFVVTHDAETQLDDRFSLDQEGLKKMIDTIRWQEMVMGTVSYGPQTPAELHNRRFRRSLFAGVDIKKGEKFTSANVRDVRPDAGLETKYFEEILNYTAAKDIEAGTPLAWELIVK